MLTSMLEHCTMVGRPDKFRVLPKIIDGGIASIIGVTCVFPLDLVKTRLQNQQVSATGEPLYRNLVDCFRKTLKSEGFFGMYSGSFITILLVTPEKGLKLAANDFFRYHLMEPSGYISVPNQMLAGGAAGFLQFTITTPMELLKIQLQDAGRVAQLGGTQQKRTTSEVIAKIYHEHGIQGFYKGARSTIFRDVIFSLVYFPLFAFLDNLGPRKPNNPAEAQPWVSFLSGLTAGATSAFSVTPFDVIKTRLQSLEKGAKEKKFNGIIDCARKTFVHEGAKAFFKGGLCRCIVIAPLYGIANTIYFLGIGKYICDVAAGRRSL